MGTFSKNKMVCNKITFVFVLVGLVSISCMVSSAAVGKDDTTPTEPSSTSKATTESKESTPGKSTESPATTQSKPTDPTATTQEVTPTGGAGCPKITYGM